MKTNRFKKILIMIALIIVFSIGIVGYAYYEMINNPIDLGFDEIGKQYMIVINNNDINDYTRLDVDEDFELLKDEEVEKLQNYMKDNNLKIKPGEYLVNQVYEYDDFIEVFHFIE